MKEYIVLKDKEVVSLNDILVGFPYKMLVFNGEFIKFCHYVANRNERFVGDLIKVYCNLLFLKSKRIKILYRLYELDRVGKLKEIHIEFISRKKFGYLFSESTLISKEDSNGNLLPYQIIPKLFLKYFVNNLFYLFKAKIKKTKIVKSWVEISERIYKDELNETQILIYPFPLKFYRQFKYIFTKIRNSEKFGLMGVPYRLSPILKSLFNKNIDYHITVFEFVGAIEHAKYFIEQQKVQEVMTTEEFEVGSFVFSKELIQNGIVVTNTCHGLSVYSPFVYYSTFYLINKKQEELYGIFNSSLNFKIIHPEEYKSKDPIITKIIYIDQGNLRKFGLLYEADLRRKVLDILNQVGQKRKSQVEVKIHPNTKQKEINELRSNYKFLTIIKNLKPKTGGVVFITLYSTAYYDFRNIGSFLFIEDNLFNPSLFFGSHIDKVHISDLKHRIEELLKNNNNE